MTGKEFEEKMETILKKIGDALDMCLDYVLVSSDPDVIADFGCDVDGNLVIDDTSLPNLKIDDIENIRFWYNKSGEEDFFIRFDFGKDSYLDVYDGECGLGTRFYLRIKTGDSPGRYLTIGEVASFLESHSEMIEKEINKIKEN